MRYYKGYPEEMKIDGRTVTLHDVERTMLSLYWDKFVCESDKTWLMDKYKEERMNYLDANFSFIDGNRRRLKKVEQLWINARQRMENLSQRMGERKQEKFRRGERSADQLRVHIEVWNLEDTEEVSYGDDERDLWNICFGEDRNYHSYWGFLCESIGIHEKENTTYVRPHVSPLSADCKDWPASLDCDFLRLKAHYQVSWQDMLKISRFYVTVDMHYK